MIKTTPIPGGSNADLTATEKVFQMVNITKRWQGDHEFILTIENVQICQGEKVALTGFSGCGKSTMLDMMAMVMAPDHGDTFSFHFGGTESVDILAAWRAKDMNKLAKIRLRHMGYVLQTGGLFPFLTIRENIEINRKSLALAEDATTENIARRLGIERHLSKLPWQLSVGERQRVAIARSMVHHPSVVIADEPTASLDPIHADEIMNLFTELTAEKNVTLIVASHDWHRVEKYGFRAITFDFRLRTEDKIVRSTVST